MKDKKADDVVDTDSRTVTKDEPRYFDSRLSRRSLVGGIIVLVGAGLLMQNLFPNWFKFDYVWPLIIIAVGVYLILKGSK